MKINKNETTFAKSALRMPSRTKGSRSGVHKTAATMPATKAALPKNSFIKPREAAVMTKKSKINKKTISTGA